MYEIWIVQGPTTGACKIRANNKREALRKAKKKFGKDAGTFYCL